MKKQKKPSFKPYHPHQERLFPHSYDDYIDKAHPVRVVSRVIESLDLKPLYRLYKGGGTSSYHPLMLLKVIVYGYLNNIYSSRKIEQALKENIHFMWLSGNQCPDHNTINRFRSDRLSKVIKEVFKQIVHLLVKSGHVDLQEVYIDGTKIEANANKYSFVWRNSIKYYEERIEEQLEDLWNYARKVTREEANLPNTPQFSRIEPEAITETINKINDSLKDKKVDTKVKKKLEYALKRWPESVKRYAKHKEILNGRNSYSRTDHDATFMRKKEDGIKNRELKACYNVQITTNKQVVINYGIYQNAADTVTLPSMLEDFKQQYSQLPKKLIADAGYGSYENYTYLEEKEIEGIVKYNYYDKEKEHARKRPYQADLLEYNEEEDYFICPAGQRMYPAGKREKLSVNGYKYKVTKYEAENCRGCSRRSKCHKGKGNRTIEINHEVRRLRRKAKRILDSPEGKRLSRLRKMDVEPVFGDIKQNMGIRRFTLRGMEKVSLETGLYALAHNFKKMIKLIENNSLTIPV
jgi:transposase